MPAPAQTPFDAFVFDMDGTLTDTEAVWDDIRRDLAARHDRPWPDGATQAMMGMSTPEWSSYLVEAVGLPGTREEAAQETIDAMVEQYHRDLTLVPGAVAAVRRMAAERPIGLATSSPRVLITAALDEMGVTDLFGATVSTEEVAAGKPAPDGYLRVCELLGVDPTRCAAIEDSTNGIRSALAAGMTVIALPPHFHPPAQDVLDRCAAVIGSLDELTEDLLVQISPRSTTASTTAPKEDTHP